MPTQESNLNLNGVTIPGVNTTKNAVFDNDPGNGIPNLLAQLVLNSQQPKQAPVLPQRLQQPVSTPAKKSPFKDFPDAFKEDDTWKVLVNGTKYRLEE